MLPSMPILFSRESQDAFGNKIEPSTSFFSQHLLPKPIEKPAQVTPVPPEPPPPAPPSPPPKKPRGRPKKEKKLELPKVDKNASNAAVAASYFQKIQSKFSPKSQNHEKFVQFKELLKTFDIHKQDAVDLYKKVAELFGDEHKELAEEFLLFLSPGQASTIGRFMDHFMQSQFTNFLQLVQATFARKPTLLRRILRAITNAADCSDVAEAQSRVLPHLRSKPLLAEMFKSFFPDERPPDSLYAHGVTELKESFLTEDDGYDVLELEDEPDARRTATDNNTLDSVYLHGRVFLQDGRHLRPACVSFPFSKEPYRVHMRRLAPSASDTDDTQPDKTTPKRTRKTNKSPTKNTSEPKTKTVDQKPKPKTPKTAKSNKKDAEQTKKGKVANENKKDDAKVKCKQDNCDASKKDVKIDFVTRINFDSSLDEEQKNKGNKKVDKKQPSSNKRKNCKDNKTKSTKLKNSNNINEKNDIFTKNKEKPALGVVKSDSNQKSKDNTLTIEKTPPAPKKRNLTNNNKKDEASKPKQSKIDPNIVEIKPKNSWTRDEDKTMLETIKCESISDHLFVRIKDLLPHRSVSEIKERFSHVMNLLEQMGVGGVT